MHFLDPAEILLLVCVLSTEETSIGLDATGTKFDVVSQLVAGYRSDIRSLCISKTH
jgi:hypothetical protein